MIFKNNKCYFNKYSELCQEITRFSTQGDRLKKPALKVEKWPVNRGVFKCGFSAEITTGFAAMHVN
jgi:hypothetical protein